MVDTKRLKAEMIIKGKSAKEVSESIGITRRMWYARMEKGVFSSDEIYGIIQCLDIKDPMPIFFVNDVT